MRRDPAAALATLIKLSARIAALPGGEDRDRLRSTVVRLALAMPGISIETLTRWAVAIEHPKLRVVALRAVALARIAAGEVNKELFRAVATEDPSERIVVLIDVAARYASERRFQTALFAALAVPDEAVIERDRALAGIFTMQVSVNFRPDAIFAPFALTDDAAREVMLAELAEYSVGRSRLSLARDVAGLVASPAAAFRAWSAIAKHAREQSFVQSFAEAFGRARLAAERIEDQEQRRAAMRKLAEEAVEAGDEAAALDVAATLDDATFSETLTMRFALRLAANGDPEGAAGRLAEIGDPGNRSAVAAALFRHYLGKARTDDAAAVAGLVTRTGDRIRTLIAEAELVLGNARNPAHDPAAAAARLAAAEADLGQIADPVEHQELAVHIAVVYRKLGDLEAVARLTETAPTDEEHDALRPVWLGAIALLEDPEKALALAGRSFDTGLRSRELSEIARAQFARGDAIGALAVAKDIPSDRIRVGLLRELAETHMAASQAAAAEIRDRPVEEGGEVAVDHAPRGLGRHVIKAVDGGMLGWARPDLPDIDGVTGKTVREMVPVVAPGRAMVIPTGFSNFNEKFSYIRYLNSLDFVGDDENVFTRGQGTLFPSFIIVESGVFDLPTLKTRIEQGGGGGNFLTSEGRVYQLNVPLLIGSDATLIISSGDVEELRLNTASNAYIVNSGRLFLVGSTLTSWDPGPGAPTPRSTDDWLDFNAFYVGWSGSETYVADAHVNGLGYGNGKSYGFVLSSGPENVLRATSNAVEKPTGIVVDSLFTDMYYGFYTYEAEDVTVVGNAYSDSAVYAIDPHDWSERLTFAYNTTLDTHAKHGIVTSREVRRSYIFGNISSGNAGSGILLDRASNDNVIAYNLSIGNQGDGLTLYESSCNLVYRNTFVGNARAGVRIRNSADVLLSENAISDNAGSGLLAYVARLEDDPRQASRDMVMDSYHAYTDFTAAHNLITGNERGAVGADSVSAMVLAGNRLSGDAETILKGFALGDAGPVALSLASSGVGVRDTCRPVRPATGCAFRDKGYLGADVVGALEAAVSSDVARCGPGTADAGDDAPGVKVAGAGR